MSDVTRDTNNESKAEYATAVTIIIVTAGSAIVWRARLAYWNQPAGSREKEGSYGLGVPLV